MIINVNILAELADNAQKTSSLLETKYFDTNCSKHSVSVFLSHKHRENNQIVEYVKTILKKHRCDSVYIDWQDPSMQHKTNQDTAKMLRQHIENNSKFILVATPDAINSHWCNWELGYGDAVKKENVAIFCLSMEDDDWKNHEYLQLYPTIELNEKLNCIDNKAHGYQYQVIYRDSNNRVINSYNLSDWLQK